MAFEEAHHKAPLLGGRDCLRAALVLLRHHVTAADCVSKLQDPVRQGLRSLYVCANTTQDRGARVQALSDDSLFPTGTFRNSHSGANDWNVLRKNGIMIVPLRNLRPPGRELLY